MRLDVHFLLALAGTGCASTGPVRAPGPAVESVAEIDVPPGNIAVAPDGEIYFTLHQFYGPPYPVARLVDGEARAVDIDHPLVSPLGIAVDARGTLWLLDNALADPDAEPALVEQRASGEVAVHPLASVSPDDAFLNDFIVDLEHEYVYIADHAGGRNAALVLLNLATGETRRVLEGHTSVVPEDIDLFIDGEPVTVGRGEQRRRPHIGVNPIAADAAYEWLYFGPMHGRSMYRVPTAVLRDASLSAAELAERVERYADKPICDGITIDGSGRIYLGDLANDAIGIIEPDRSYRSVAQGPGFSWMDAFAVAPDGSVVTPSNQLHRSPPLNGGEDASRPPFEIFRIRL